MLSQRRVDRKNKLPLSSSMTGYSACVWAFIFAAMSFYWALGGTAGTDTLGEIANPELAEKPGFIVLVWGTGVLKALGGLLALALVRPWGRIVPRWLLVTAVGCGGIFMIVYSGANFLVRLLMWADLLDTPESMHSTAARWHLLFWNPWWLLGGILFSATAWLAIRSTRDKRK